MRCLISLISVVLFVSACGGGSSGGDNGVDEVDENDSGEVIVQQGLLTNQSFEFQGGLRNYHIYVPEFSVDAPIVMLFHGYSNSHDDILGLSGKASPYEVWLDIAARENVIILVPNGLDNGTEKGWNDCRNDADGNSREDDVAFVRALIDFTVATYQADPARVFANGTSNGGHFSIRLGFEMYDKLTAFAAIAAANSVNTKCMDSVVPVSALFMNGTADPLLPYTGGQMTGDRGEVYSAAASVADWVDRNSADTEPVSFSFPDLDSTSDNSSVTKHEYQNGGNGTEVVLYRVAGGGHNEPSILIEKENSAGEQNRDIEMAEEVWQFFHDKVRQ